MGVGSVWRCCSVYGITAAFAAYNSLLPHHCSEYTGAKMKDKFEYSDIIFNNSFVIHFMRLWCLFRPNSLGVEGPPGIPFKMTRKKVKLFCARFVPCGRRAIRKPKNNGFVNFHPRSCLHKKASKFIFFGFQFSTKIDVPKRVLGQ